jgi:predicted Zn-dependent peptidase
VTDFGSIHTEFILDGVEHRVPAGIAHYLEHKMFDLPGRDVSAEFAAMGASVNAFTSYDVTAYYFSCTEHFEENLKLLLEFVSTPYFTEESVEKERGIIDQEIGMNADNPDSQIFERLMPALFENHPVRVPILGTSESIRRITPEDLYLCHRAFYNPANMTLCVVGDVEPEEVARIAESMLPQEPAPVGLKKMEWPETMERPFEEPAREEASPTQVDAMVKELGCYVEMTGIHTPHTGQIFEAVFETDDRRILKFRIPQEMYEGLEKGLHGRLTYVEEDLYSFEPDEEDVS